ncbi:phage tail tape measure protein [Salmonella enterica]|nr:phage tail tape measure protein [Salmonella enterica]
MADEIASLVIKVESGGINKATDALNNLAKSGQLAEDAAGSLSDAWGGLGKSAQTATGYAGKTAGQLQDMARALAGNGVTQHDAAGVLAQVVGSGAFSGSDVNMVARTAARMKEVVGQSVDETIRQFKRLQDDPVNAAKELDNGMTDALTQFALTGKMNFKSFAVSVLTDLAKMEARIATSKALGMLMNWGMSALGIGAAGVAGGSTPSGAYESAAAGLQFAKGGAISSPDLSMYSGQILTQPTFFKFARGGVAGEAGPEAILPLARDSRGYMGVRLADKGGKQQLPPIQITVTQHIDQRGTDQNDQAAAQRNNLQLAKMLSDMVETKINSAIDNEMRPGGKLAGVR